MLILTAEKEKLENLYSDLSEAQKQLDSLLDLSHKEKNALKRQVSELEKRLAEMPVAKVICQD